MTSLSANQLQKLFLHIRVPFRLTWKRKYFFQSGEVFIHFKEQRTKNKEITGNHKVYIMNT